MLKFYSQIAVKIQKNPAKDKIFFQGAQKKTTGAPPLGVPPLFNIWISIS